MDINILSLSGSECRVLSVFSRFSFGCCSSPMDNQGSLNKQHLIPIFFGIINLGGIDVNG